MSLYILSQSKDCIVPPVATRRPVSEVSVSSEDDEYIDPTSIVSVPALTARMKELQVNE